MKSIKLLAATTLLLAAPVSAQSIPARVVVSQAQPLADGTEARRIDRVSIGPNGEVALNLGSTGFAVDRLASGGIQQGLIEVSRPLGGGTFDLAGLTSLAPEGAPLWGPNGELFVDGNLTSAGAESAGALAMLNSDATLTLIGHAPLSNLVGAYSAEPERPQTAADGGLLVRAEGTWFLHGLEPQPIVGPGDPTPGEAGQPLGVLDGLMLPDGSAVFWELDDYYLWDGSALTRGPSPLGLDEPLLRAVQAVSATGFVLWRGPVSGIDTAFVGALGEAPTSIGPATVGSVCPNGGSLDVRNMRTIDRSGSLVIVESCGIVRLAAGATTWLAAAGDLAPFESGSAIELGSINDTAVSPDGEVVIFSASSQHPTLGGVQAIWRVVGNGVPEFVARSGGAVEGAGTLSSFERLVDGMVNDDGQFVLLAQTDDGDVALAFGQDLSLADLSLSGLSPEADGGTEVDVTIDIANAGPNAASDVLLRIHHPAASFGTLPDGCEDADPEVVCDIGELAADAQTSLTLSVGGLDTVSATVSSTDTADPVPGNNSINLQIQRYYGFPDECCYDNANPPGTFGDKGEGGCCATTRRRPVPVFELLMILGLAIRRRR